MHNQKLHEQKIQVEFDTYKLELDTLKAKNFKCECRCSNRDAKTDQKNLKKNQ